MLDSIADVVAQLPDDGELLVVDQSAGSELESTRAAVQALADPRVRHMAITPPGLPNARNVGAAHTTGDLLLYLDDDVRLHAGCIAAHVAAFADPRIGGCVGRIVERVVVPNSSGTANRLAFGGRIVMNLSGTEPARVQTLAGGNMCLRRQALLAAGGFDRNYLGTAFLEDADLSTRVRRCGWDLCFEPQAALDHLSAPAGGVRVGGQQTVERWRFHNTGYFVRRHRGRRSLPAMVATFSAIAVKRAIEWRDPSAPAMLLAALHEGWARAAGPADTSWD